MEFMFRMIIYVGFIVFAILFYRGISDTIIEARTMPMMAIIAVIFFATIMLVSDVVAAIRARSVTEAVAPVPDRSSAEGLAPTGSEDTDLTEDDADGGAAVAAQETIAGDGLEPVRVLRLALPASILVAAYIFLLPILGFVIASIGFLAGLAVLLGARSIVRVALYAVTFPIAFQWFFENLLGLRLP